MKDYLNRDINPGDYFMFDAGICVGEFHCACFTGETTPSGKIKGVYQTRYYMSIEVIKREPQQVVKISEIDFVNSFIKKYYNSFTYCEKSFKEAVHDLITPIIETSRKIKHLPEDGISELIDTMIYEYECENLLV